MQKYGAEIINDDLFIKVSFILTYTSIHFIYILTDLVSVYGADKEQIHLKIAKHKIQIGS